MILNELDTIIQAIMNVCLIRLLHLHLCCLQRLEDIILQKQILHNLNIIKKGYKCHRFHIYNSTKTYISLMVVFNFELLCLIFYFKHLGYNGALKIVNRFAVNAPTQGIAS